MTKPINVPDLIDQLEKVIEKRRAQGCTMTPEKLKQAGYRRFLWNNTIPEYWKSFGNDPDDFDQRIGVRFGEWRNEPFTALLVWGSAMRYLKHIQTVEQLEQLYQLLRSRPHGDLLHRVRGAYITLRGLAGGYYDVPGLLALMGQWDLIEQWQALNDQVSHIIGDMMDELDRQTFRQERGKGI